MNKTQPLKINIDESINSQVLRVAETLDITKSELVYKLIMLYLKYYGEIDSKEIIESNVFKARLTSYVQVRLSGNEKVNIQEAAKKLKLNANEFCRLAIRRGLDYYKTFGEKFFEEDYQVFSILEELKELKEYKELTEKRMKILYDTITEAGVSIPSSFSIN
jgi:hypothetical protein